MFLPLLTILLLLHFLLAQARSGVMWLNGSDNQPPPDQEQVYLDIEKELRWPNPILSSATAKLGTGGAENGVRMTGPATTVFEGEIEL